MTQGKRAGEQETMAWWERLVFERPSEDFTACPACGTLNDSMDVVCTADSAALVGAQMAESMKAGIVNSLRIMALAAALAVGYLEWTWPTYVFAGFVVIAFFGLFLRNHPTSRLFFFAISSSGFVAYGVWSAFAPEDAVLFHVAVLLLVGLLFLELPFLVAYTLRTEGGDPRRHWMLSKGVDLQIGTLTWIALTLTVSVLCILAAITSWLGGRIGIPFPQLVDLNSLLVRVALATLGAGEIAALVSSTVHSLRGEPFRVTDRWTSRQILEDLEFERWTPESTPTPLSWTGRLADTVTRIAVSSANGLIQGLENSYNNFVVRFVNTLAQTAVRIANSVRRAAISTARHIARSLRRFMVLNTWCGQWAFHTGVRYVRVFVLPVMVCFAGATLIYAMGEDFSAYVHGGSVLIPVILLGRGVVVIILFTVGTGLLLRIDLGSYFEKMLNALSTFGTSAFLFFVLSAWLLGVVGMLTHGPFRIGWVTILSTLLLVAVFVLAQRRTPNRESEA